MSDNELDAIIVDAEVREVAGALLDFAGDVNRRLAALEKDRDALSQRLEAVETRQAAAVSNARRNVQ